MISNKNYVATFPPVQDAPRQDPQLLHITYICSDEVNGQIRHAISFSALDRIDLSALGFGRFTPKKNPMVPGVYEGSRNALLVNTGVLISP
jgi:hypothetical protein